MASPIPDALDALSTSQRIAVVTGASSGIGRCYAQQLAKSGYDLLLTARDSERLEAVCKPLADNGVTIVSHPADLSDPVQIARFAEVIGSLPRIDFLVNNAGFGTMGDFADVDAEMHQAMIQLHCTTTVRFSHAALGLMRRDHPGTIVNVSSMSAFLIGPGQATYAATKAMLVTFTESLQGEFDRDQIRFQVLCPGFTRTGFHDRLPLARFDRSQIPQRAWMTPEQVVEASFAGLRSRRVLCVPGVKNRWLKRLLSIRKVRELAGKKVRKR